jgi:hypothetical protein
MKKVLLIGFILVILLLAFPQGVMASDSGSATVSATITNYIDLIVSGPATSPWVLDYTVTQCDAPINTQVGCNKLSNEILFDIQTNAAWKLRLMEDVTYDGYMKSGTTALTNPLYIGPVNSGTTYLKPTISGLPQDLQTGTLPDSGIVPQFAKSLQQRLNIADDSTFTYGITLYFNAIPTV